MIGVFAEKRLCQLKTFLPYPDQSKSLLTKDNDDRSFPRLLSRAVRKSMLRFKTARMKETSFVLL